MTHLYRDSYLYLLEQEQAASGDEGKSEENNAGESSPKDEEDLEKPEPALQDPKLDEAKPPAEEEDQTVPSNPPEDASSDLQIAFEVLDLAKNIFKR